MKILAPGKLILSGEHAVVYGKPALAMAVNRYVCAQMLNHEADFISLNFSDLSYERSISFDALDKLKNSIKDNYLRFKQGSFNIREVLQKPFELAQFALGLCLEILPIKLSRGMQIHLASTIPIGCGMGSSAATILSIMHALALHAGVKIPAQQIYELGLQAENMQHGTSSGLDLHVSLYGGCSYVKDKIITARSLPTMPLYLVNTGVPQSSTGECVSTVAHHFKQSMISDDFANVTEIMVASLNNNSITKFKTAITANHVLLNKIGVVPPRVQQFIQEINILNGAAKICGAGAVSGNAAGIVMVVIDDENALKCACDKYGYSILQVTGETRGVHVGI
jgi:mevalonate kinase